MSEPLCPMCDDTGRRESEWEPSLTVPCECGGVGSLASAAAIMAEATSWFVQESYALEGLGALAAAGWTISPPAVANEGQAAACSTCGKPTAPFQLAVKPAAYCWGHEVDRLRDEVEHLRSLKVGTKAFQNTERDRLAWRRRAWDAELRERQLRGQVKRLLAEVDFWDHFHDEAFPNDPYLSGAMRGEVERLRGMRDGTATSVPTCDCPPPYAECPHPPAPGPPSEAKRPCVICDKPTVNVCGDWGDEYEGEPMCRPCTEQYWEDLHG